jgi:hypothetical protein
MWKCGRFLYAQLVATGAQMINGDKEYQFKVIYNF